MGRRRKNRSSQPGLSLKAQWLSWYAERLPVFRFGLKFGLLVALYYALFSIPSVEARVFLPYLEANAWLANAILHGLGQPTQISDVTIQSQSPPFAMAIRRGCDAVDPTWLLCAAMISFPAPFRHKLWGMLAGIVLLQVLNLVRLVSLFLIGIHFPGFFNSAHMELWPTAFIVIAIAFFAVWREGSSRIESHAAA